MKLKDIIGLCVSIKKLDSKFTSPPWEAQAAEEFASRMKNPEAYEELYDIVRDLFNTVERMESLEVNSLERSSY